MKNYFIFLFISLAILMFSFFGFDALAQCDASWTEYSCGGGCGGAILATDCSEYCSAWETECTAWETECAQWSTICIEWDLDGECLATEDICVADRDICTAERDVCVSCGSSCGAPYSVGACSPWQVCQENGVNYPDCQCAGTCLETPTSPRYYDNPTYSDRPDRNLGNTNLKLPVKLDWNDVQGWGQPDGPQSYRMTIGNTRPNDPYSNYSLMSEFIPPACTLKSASTHNWQVSACCAVNGSDCGPASNWSFTTAFPPEPVSPSDPDWQGTERIEGVSIPALLDWCSVDQAQSYYFQLFKNNTLYLPYLIERTDGALPSELLFGTEVLTKYSAYEWEIATCLNATGTRCGLACLNSQAGDACADFSQYWRLTTGDMGLPTPQIITPQSSDGIPVVNMSDYLSWGSLALRGVLSYKYEIIRNGQTVFSSSTPGSVTSVSFKDFWEELDFDQTYSWQVSSCWDEEGRNCEQDRSVSNFRTTGTPPTNIIIGPRDERGEVIIPTSIKFDAMPGAGSYYYEISPNNNFSVITAAGTIPNSPSPEGWADYPNLRTRTNYWLRLTTCADDKGEVCGAAATQNFTTFALSSPSNPRPANGGQLFTYEKQLSWDEVTGARYYQYRITSGPEGIVSTNSTFLDTGKLALGNYTWSVRACLDKDCQETGDWSAFSFTLVQPEKCDKGLVPCGRDCDIAATPYNERESCQFQHIFLLFKNILDFVLWTLIPIILVLLALLSGLIYYFSMGDASVVAQVKSIWKSAGIGVLIIFSAWFIINWLLLFLGFQVQFFGRWWQSPF